MDIDVLISTFEKFVCSNYRERLLEIYNDMGSNVHFGVEVSIIELLNADYLLASTFLKRPKIILPYFDVAINNAYNTTIKQSNVNYCGSSKKMLHCRLHSMPSIWKEHFRQRIPNSDDDGKFISLSGTVMKMGSVKVFVNEEEYTCQKCLKSFIVKADYYQYYSLTPPTSCDICFSSKIVKSGKRVYRDYQEVRIIEKVGLLSVSCVPQSIWMTLEDDLVDSCRAGQEVTIVGLVCSRWRPVSSERPCRIQTTIKGIHVFAHSLLQNKYTNQKYVEEFEEFWEKYREAPLRGRDILVSSFCGHLCGLYIVKLALLCVLCGGVSKCDPSGMRVRGESHMLLVGDPGTGKSQMLRCASALMTRSILTTGTGTTSAGLTVAAVQEDGHWTLEPGALVLADGGICCIDEFNAIRSHERTYLHEAMEQQTISVAKAGLVTTLRSRCSIIAAANAKNAYDISQSLNVNVDLESPLLSRFDLIFVLLDKRDLEWDRCVSSFILELKRQQNNSSFKLTTGQSELWSSHKLSAYIAHVRRFNPEITDDASRIITRYYQYQRASQNRNTARTTVRLLESIIRLVQAHAKLMFRRIATVQDAIMAILMIESSLQGSALLDETIVAAQSKFPDDPDEQCIYQSRILLHKLDFECSKDTAFP